MGTKTWDTMTTAASTPGFFFPRPLVRSAISKDGVGWSSAVRRIIAIFGLAGILAPGLAQASGEHASDSSQDNPSAATENTGVPVEIDGRPILVVYTQVAGFTPQERAAAIQQRIIALGKRRDIAPEAIRAEEPTGRSAASPATRQLVIMLVAKGNNVGYSSRRSARQQVQQ